MTKSLCKLEESNTGYYLYGMIKSILIANRGEIARRVIRTAKKMGIRTVAVYSDIDRNALHVREADEAYHIGPSPSSESYLNQDKIIEACKTGQVEAVHPGYGFLSENADFARRLEKEGIILIGPSAHSMQIMGSKLEAKNAVSNYDIPMVPGVDHAVLDPNEAIRIAEDIGYPILIKASAGGGGKGMRTVHEPSEITEQFERAVSEAISSFGDGSVFIEKFVQEPRHIEIQVLFDQQGKGVHLFERECSIQRRHQKVVEEAPSANMTHDIRMAMGVAALEVGKACNYVGAGTVEFLMDKDYNFYFLEMNTRLQVEHPVSELITDVDLVQCQIEIASGLPLKFDQDDLTIQGHAIELRIYAENPKENFMPSVGNIERYTPPRGEGIRLDDAYEEGMEIPLMYDPMIGKLVSYGSNRNQAIARMNQAIQEFKIQGFETTLPFGSFVMKNKRFLSGNYNTHFVQEEYSGNENETTKLPDGIIGSIATAVIKDVRKKVSNQQNVDIEW